MAFPASQCPGPEKIAEVQALGTAEGERRPDVPAVDQGPVLLEWDDRRFHNLACIQEAARNNGIVELAEDRFTGRLVAVKAMPYSWTRGSHEEFVAAQPDETERPWQDIMITFHLSSLARLTCVCEYIGLFLRQSNERGTELCFVLSYCAGGDLFSWLERSLQTPGLDRDTAARRLIRKVAYAVYEIHSQGVSHGDLSLENVLIADPETSEQVCVIDFGASQTGSIAQRVRGKPSYQAPEMHACEEYNAAAADAFAIGVMAFTLRVGNYPWRSTRPLLCPRFSFFAERGLQAYLARQNIKNEDGEVVSLLSRLSPEAVDFLAGLLAYNPADRLTLRAALAHPWLASPG
mmetsp:Transcript_27992/g.63356  ORF Transcript_27992/g.63356 Transcript_27992/m.63356 type:complete len:348 (-) Transcript_27992:142-1185(-)